MTRYILSLLLAVVMAGCDPIGDPDCGRILELGGDGSALIANDETGALKVCRCKTIHDYNATIGQHHCYDQCTVFICRTKDGQIH